MDVVLYGFLIKKYKSCYWTCTRKRYLVFVWLFFILVCSWNWFAVWEIYFDISQKRLVPFFLLKSNTNVTYLEYFLLEVLYKSYTVKYCIFCIALTRLFRPLFFYTVFFIINLWVLCIVFYGAVSCLHNLLQFIQWFCRTWAFFCMDQHF